MATNGAINFIVNLVSKGGAKAKGQVDQLANSANRAGDSHAKAEKSARNYFHTQEKGIIGTANSTKSFSKLANSINGGGSSSVVAAYAVLMSNVFALTAAFNALKAAASMQQIELGLQALGNRTGQTLSIVADGLRNVTDNTISMEQALRSSAQVMSAGFGADELYRLGKVANDASFALGRNMVDSMDRLTRGVVKLEPELLDELGIMTRLGEATKSYAQELGKPESALTNLERRQAFYNAVMAEGELKFGGLAEAAGNTRGYDKLLASLVDLGKGALNLINGPLLGLASFLSSAPVLLTGLSAAFLGSLKAMIPGINDLSQKLVEAAEKMREGAAKEAADILAIDNIGVLDSLKSKIDDSSASLTDYKKALSLVSGELHNFQEEENALLYKADQVTLRTRFTKQQKAELAEVQASIEATIRAEQELREVISATQGVMAQEAGASAVASASSIGTMGQSIGYLKESVSQYNKSLITAHGNQGRLTNAMVLGRTAMHAFSLSVKVAGAALLTMLPIIGWIVAGVGLLWSGIKKLNDMLTPKSVKEYRENLKELSKILDTVDEKSKEFQKTQSSTANAYLRQSQSLTLMSNMATEIGDKVEEAHKQYIESLKKVENEEKRSTEVRVAQAAAAAAKLANPAMWAGAKIADWGLEKYTGVESTSELADFRSISTEVTKSAGFQAYKKLIESDIPELEKSARVAFEKAAKGRTMEQIRQLDRSEQVKIFAQATIEGTALFKELGAAVEDTTSAIKEGESAISSFMQSLVMKTSVDDLVKAFSGITDSLLTQRILMQEAGLEAEEYYKTLSGIGENMAKFLTPDARQTLNSYKLNDAIIQRLSGKEDIGTLTKQEKQQLEVARAQLKVEEGKMGAVEEQLYLRDTQFRTMRSEEAQSKRQLTLEKARVSALSEIYNTTAEGLRAQFDAQDRIRGLEDRVLNSREKTLNMLEDGNSLSIEEVARLEELRAARTSLNADQAREFDDLKSRQEAIYVVEEQRLGIGLERATLSEQSLTSAQKEAQILQRTVATLNSILSQRQQIAETVLSAAQAEAEVSDLLSGRISTGEREVQNLLESNHLRRAAAKLEMESAKRANARQKDVVRAYLTRGNLTQLEKEAVSSQIRQLDIQDQLADATYAAAVQEIDATENLERLQKSIFDIRSEGIEWQREGLSILEKEHDLTRQILDSEQKREASRKEILRKTMGIESDSNSDLADEIKVERQKYELALQQLSLRRTMVELEFALIDGQREILAAQLEFRRSELETIGGSAAHIEQLTSAINILRSFDSGPAKELAQRAITSELEAQRASLKALTTRGAGFNNGIAGAVAGAISKSLESAATRPSIGAEVSEAFDDHGISTNKHIEQTIAPVVDHASRTNELLTNIDANIASLVTKAVQAATGNESFTASSAVEAIVKVGKDLQSKGLRVSEHAEFGGVKAKHEGRGHAEGRAIDVNVSRGNVEWNNPAMKARFDTLAKELRELGATVLWGVEGHYDHMHVEFRNGYTRYAEAAALIETATANLPTAVASAVAESVAPLVDSSPTQVADVEVVGKRNTPAAANDNKFGWMDTLGAGADILDKYATVFSQLGPNGELAGTAVAGISSVAQALMSLPTAFKEIEAANSGFDTSFDQSAAKFAVVTGAIAAGIGMVAQMAEKSAAARINAVDKEIAAEQKRDGKSAASLEKIKALEAKKEGIAKKSFEIQKKLQMAQAVVSTASGIAMALASAPPPFSFALAGLVGAMGAAQLALIASTTYDGANPGSLGKELPSTLTIGKRGDSVDLARNNANAGGELGYIRGSSGHGRNASDYSVIGSAYGGRAPRGYGNASYLVGETGPEIITPEVPVNVAPVNDNTPNHVSAEFHINAIDASGVQDMLYGQRGFIIGAIREAANANGQSFLEDVNTNVYTKPNVGKL